MNNLILRRCIALLFLLFMVGVSGGAYAQIIYGLDNARHFKATHDAPFTVHAGAFRSEKTAQSLKEQFTTRLHYPVKVVASGSYYSVVIGPVGSSEAVRKIGELPLSSAVMKSDKVANVNSDTPLLSVIPPFRNLKASLVKIDSQSPEKLNELRSKAKARGDWFMVVDNVIHIL